ncbi:protein-tyrosine phosphatase-like protein [Sporodiniella umbellata]|nr:protein-tyrosine phosphatase-like protein [Sporodiniella umbellata]
MIDTDSYCQKKERLNKLKTSDTHPLNISHIMPLCLQGYMLPDHCDLYDFIQEPLNYVLNKPSSIKGNVYLSSCPGKKVRLSGPVKGRVSINRDLDLDLTRIESFGITMIVCCLDDYELYSLGVSWSEYQAEAAKKNIEIYRLPINDGGCPDSMSVMETTVESINALLRQGSNVLIHCRAGIGRAGLVASCWLLENFLCQTAEKAVSVVRSQRSVRAVETLKQANYIIRYLISMRQRHGLQPPNISPTRPQAKLPNRYFFPPSIDAIAQLEYDIVKGNLL